MQKIDHVWLGTAWFIEGDIARCVDSLDHEILLTILSEKIHDGRFMRLIANLLKAGYLANWRFNATLSGTPQGGVLSPLLANVYLDRSDKFVETALLPQYNRGLRRKWNPEYATVLHRANYLTRTGRRNMAKSCAEGHRQCRQLFWTIRSIAGCATCGTQTIPVGVHGSQGRGRGNQGSDRRIPA